MPADPIHADWIISCSSLLRLIIFIACEQMEKSGMDDEPTEEGLYEVQRDAFSENPPVVMEVSQRQYPRRWKLPLLLFIATCASTYFTGGAAFAFSLLTILLAHEFGHFLQAKRYGVPATYPCFIPMPLSPIGTMGAVIAMQPGRGDRRSIFDIAISGPIAGFFPALAFSVYGLMQSTIIEVTEASSRLSLGEPLIFKFMVYLIFGEMPEGTDVLLHPVAFAGWVGIFITALNLFPIGQLDGGHILYTLLLKRSRTISKGLLLAAVVGVIYFGYWGWTLMLLLLFAMGPEHPKTANDDVPLGGVRIALGWMALLFMPFGFTPMPFALQ